MVPHSATTPITGLIGAEKAINLFWTSNTVTVAFSLPSSDTTVR